ncbi:MAG: hypothetical protein AAGG01_23655, partial [Planctomycetota bacterium]
MAGDLFSIQGGGVLGELDDAEGTARVFDLELGKEIAALPLRGSVPGTRGARVALSPDGSRIALGYEPPRPSLADEDVVAAPTVEVRTVGAPEEDPASWSAGGVTTRVLALAFSPSGERLAAADFYGRVHVWATEDGTDHREHTDRARMTDLRFSPDGLRLVSFGVSASLYVWRTVRSAAAFRVAPIEAASPRPVIWGSFCAGGRRVALLEGSGRAAAFAAPLSETAAAAEPGEALFTLDVDEGSALSDGSAGRPLAQLAVSSDGGVAAWVDPAEGVAAMTDLESGERLQELGRTDGRSSWPSDWPGGALRALDVIRSGPGTAAALMVDVNGGAWIWLLGQAPVRLADPADSHGWVLGAFRGPTVNSGVLLVSSLQEIRCLDGLGMTSAGEGAAGGRRLEEPTLPSSAPRDVTALDVHPGGSQLVVSTAYGRVYRWDLSTGRLRSGDKSRLKAAWIRLLDGERVVVAARGPGTNRVLGGSTHVAPAAHHSFVIRSMAVVPEA